MEGESRVSPAGSNGVSRRPGKWQQAWQALVPHWRRSEATGFLGTAKGPSPSSQPSRLQRETVGRPKGSGTRMPQGDAGGGVSFADGLACQAKDVGFT